MEKIKIDDKCVTARSGKWLYADECKEGYNNQKYYEYNGQIRGDNNKCVSIEDGRMKPGEHMLLDDCNGNIDQSWALIKSGKLKGLIQNTESDGKICLGKDGDKIITAECKAPAKPPKDIDDEPEPKPKPKPKPEPKITTGKIILIVLIILMLFILIIVGVFFAIKSKKKNDV